MPRITLRLLIAGALMLFPQHSVFSQPYSEGQLIGVYIFKMAKFIYWDTPNPNICTTENSLTDLNETLEKLASSSGNGTKFSVIKNQNLTELSSCSMVFISEADETNLINIFLQLRDKPVVTASTIPGFTSRGGMFGLKFDSSGRISAEVKHSKVQERGIKVNANLLKVMKVIE